MHCISKDINIIFSNRQARPPTHHVSRVVGEHWNASPHLTPETSLGQGQDPSVKGVQGSYSLTAIHLEARVLRQLSAVVRGHVPCLVPHPQ